MIPVDLSRLDGRDRWQRVTEAWIDNTHPDAFTHTVRIVEPDAGVEVSAVAKPSPTYEIVEAHARAVSGQVAAEVLAGCETLAGVPMVAGLGRRLAEATGDGPGARLVRDAFVEIARLARQVAKLPRERAERAVAAGPDACWELDRAGFADLPDSCFTYSDAGRALFGTRSIATPMTAELYSPRPGQARVFVRQKVARLERIDDRLRLFHSMHDNAHGFEVTYEVETATGRIVRAESVTSRLPYAGVCSEPQRRIASLLGETLDAGLGKRIQGHVGGVTGCAQLYDLTADLLRLLAR
ncbi:MAG: DUF2889 domain-containing protein [Candidatus Rokubacteria bacterium]|nr:DUF2889 domain-containing protein [Candidatus Rokubacteria bacterium]